MIYILAILLPFLAVLLSGRIFAGILLLLLQLSVFGWIPAIVIALFIVNSSENKKLSKNMIKAIKDKES